MNTLFHGSDDSMPLWLKDDANVCAHRIRRNKKSLTSHFHGFLLFSFFQFCAKMIADYITSLIQCKKL